MHEALTIFLVLLVWGVYVEGAPKVSTETRQATQLSSKYVLCLPCQRSSRVWEKPQAPAVNILAGDLASGVQSGWIQVPPPASLPELLEFKLFVLGPLQWQTKSLTGPTQEVSRAEPAKAG